MTVLRVDTIAGTGTTFGPTLDGNLEFNSQNYIVLPKGTSNQQGVLRTTEDVIGVGGTYYDNLVLAMPFNEATGLRDVSSRNRNPGTYGNVAISTAQSKYYGSSAYFDGSGDKLMITESSNNEFTFGTYDFTVEFFANPSNLSGSKCWITTADPISDEQGIWIGTANTNLYWLVGNGTWFLSGIVGTISLNTWQHIALTKSGTTFRAFIDGIQVDIRSDSTPITNTNNSISIGGRDAGAVQYSNGYLQDLRIYKGLAKYTENFTPPDRIAEIGVGFKAGQLRYNTDSNKVELYDGNQWTEVQSSRPDLNGGARGLTGGGGTDSIEYINIISTGSIANFGALATSSQLLSSFGSSTRGYWAGGREGPTKVDRIQKVTFASLGDTTDFGDLKNGGRDYPAGCSNSTRGLIAGGYNPAETSNVEYVTMTSTGAGQDFGTLSSGVVIGAGAVSSPTRAIVFGKDGATVNTIEFFTITTLGNSQDFGDTTDFAAGSSANTNGTRAVLALGSNTANINTLNYVTMTTRGNATNFGDLTVARRYSASMSSPVRGVFAGGYTDPEGALNISTIDYIVYAAEGNAVDFGDLTTARGGCAGCSNAHGGL